MSNLVMGRAATSSACASSSDPGDERSGARQRNESSLHVIPPTRTAVQGTTLSASRSPECDDKVVELVRAGDVRTALERLMQRHSTAILRYCRRALSDSALADDILQQVFMQAFRDLPNFAHRSSLRTWLLGIARHRVLDAVKRRRRMQSRVESSGPIDLPDPQPSAIELLENARLQASLIACIAELEEPVRTCMLLRYQRGLSYEEISVICGDRPGTLQARVVRALRRLRGLARRHCGRSAG